MTTSHLHTIPGHIDPLSLPFHRIPASALPDATVKLTLLNCGELIASRVMPCQRDTVEEMKETGTAVVFAWVVEKQMPGGEPQRYLWDLGIVSSADKLTPLLKATVDTLPGLFLSHAHTDHFCCLSDFPSRLPLYVGPGTKDWVKGGDEEGRFPGFPSKFWKHPEFVGEVGEEGVRGFGPEGGASKKWQKVGSFEKA